MLINEIKGRRILIWGMGSEGQAAKAYIERHGLAGELNFYNDEEGADRLHELLAKTDVIIRSPGVSIYKEGIHAARKAGIKITSCSDLFLSEMRANHPHTKVIGISGSKGKSTSVSMLDHIFRSAGCKAALGGNIGKPLIELLDEEYDYIVGEFSSYQASDLTASPQIVMFTNLFSVHTDWHQGHDNYCRDKIHLAAHQQPGDVCWVCDGNEQLKFYCQDLPNLRYYDVLKGFHAEGRELYYQNQKLLTIDELQISGNHNLDNLAGVMSIVKSLGLDVSAALESLKTFAGLPHRLQKVARIDNVLFINDSISTAPEAAVAAMKSFAENLVIISGGIENQQDYTDYARYIESDSRVKGAVTLFQCGAQIAESLRRNVKRSGFTLLEAENLNQAVTAAFRQLQALGGGIVLFSPTAPSFGYYKNFMERGQDFINNVKKLEK